MKIFIACFALSLVCCIYAQTYGISLYDPYDSNNGIGRLTRSRLGRSRGLSGLSRIRQLARRRSMRGSRRVSRLGRRRVYRPVGSRYRDTGASYNPRRRIYSSSY